MIQKLVRSVKFHIVTNYIYFLYFQYFDPIFYVIKCKLLQLFY